MKNIKLIIISILFFIGLLFVSKVSSSDLRENFTSNKVSSTIVLRSVSITITFLQSDPPSEMEYANKLPSSEKDIPAKEIVPFSEN